MPGLDEVLKETGDEMSDKIKSEFKTLLNSAKSDANELSKETARKVEKWLKLRVNDDLDDDELKELLEARKSVVKHHLLKEETEKRAAMERTSNGLIDLLKDKLIGIAFKSLS